MFECLPLADGLLAHDMVERFLLHYFGWGSAHAYTRGTVTTPEASHPDRDVGSTDYVAAGVMMAPTYLKWMLLFEDPNTATVWLGKALPREWLAPDTHSPITVANATTRYGRVSYTLSASSEEVVARSASEDVARDTSEEVVARDASEVDARGSGGAIGSGAKVSPREDQTAKRSDSYNLCCCYNCFSCLAAHASRFARVMTWHPL